MKEFGQGAHDLSPPEDGAPCPNLPDMESEGSGPRPGGAKEGTSAEDLSACFQTYHALVRAYLARITWLTEHEREDCHQEVWLRALRRPSSFARRLEVGGLDVWLLRQARRIARKTLERKARLPVVVLGEEHAAVLRDPGPDPARAQEREEEGARWWRLLAAVSRSFPDWTFEAFHWHCIEGRPVAEFAGLQDCTPRRVTVTLYRFRHKVREHVAGVGVNPGA